MNRRWIRHKRALYSAIFLALMLLLFLGGGGYLGLFSTVEITRESRTYTIVGIERYGSYRKNLRFLRQEVQPHIQRQQLTDITGAPCAIVYHRFDRRPKGERRSIVGYLLTEEADVKPPLQVVHFNADEAIVATIAAHRNVAPFKAYRPIRETATIDLDAYPALEIYHEVDHAEIIVPTRVPQEGSSPVD